MNIDVQTALIVHNLLTNDMVVSVEAIDEVLEVLLGAISSSVAKFWRGSF